MHGQPPIDLPADWPHRQHSRVHDVGSIRWHVQHWPAPGSTGRDAADAPQRRERVLLLHGTGASAHSWHALAPLLAEHAEILAPDLPGHGFTRTTPDQHLSVEAVSSALRELLNALDWQPTRVIGHSAGAAVACRMALDAVITPTLVVGINAALLPLQGPVGRLFAPIARLLATQSYVPSAFASWATWPGTTRRLLQGTGSRIDPVGERCYQRLVADPRHVAGALRLMACWDLEPLQRDLSRLAPGLRLIVGSADRMLPPSHAQRIRALLPSAQLCELPGLGHLAHEEDAPAVAQLCLAPAPPRLRLGAAARAAARVSTPQAARGGAGSGLRT